MQPTVHCVGFGRLTHVQATAHGCASAASDHISGADCQQQHKSLKAKECAHNRRTQFIGSSVMNSIILADAVAGYV